MSNIEKSNKNNKGKNFDKNINNLKSCNKTNNTQLNKKNNTKIKTNSNNLSLITKNNKKNNTNNTMNNKKKYNILKIKYSNNIRKINSVRNSAHPHPTKKILQKSKSSKNKNINKTSKDKSKDNFEIEYEKINNLCYYKKNHRGNIEIQNYMERKNKQYKDNKIKQKNLQLENYDKLYKNFINLEKEIKKNNIHKFKKDKQKKVIDDDDDESELNEKSNGSIDNNNNNLEKKYYFGCLQVRWILSKSNNNTKNNNNVNPNPNNLKKESTHK